MLMTFVNCFANISHTPRCRLLLRIFFANLQMLKTA